MDDEEQKNVNFDKFKQFIKRIINKKFKKYIIIAVAIILVAITICESSQYLRKKDALFPKDADDPEYNEYCPLAYFENIYVTDDGTLMAETSVDDMWENDKRYKRYLSSEDALAYLLNAQVVSQYPYIESAEKDELNGTIKFYRNSSQIPMVYVSQDTFDGYVDYYNNSGDEDSKNSALQSFTINKDGTIKVAYQYGKTDQVISNYSEAADEAAQSLGAEVTSDTTSQGQEIYSVSSNNSHMYTKNLSYRSVVQNYSLPFELLWAMVVMADNGSTWAGNSENFAHAVASMAYDGEIALVIDDNTQTTKTEETTGFDEITYESYCNILLKHDGFTIGNGEDINNPVKKEHFVSTHTQVETTSSPSLRIKKIESWSAIYDGKDSFETTKTNGPTETDKSVPETSKWVTISDKEYTTKYADCDVDAIKKQFTVSDENDAGYSLDYRYQYRKRKENNNHITSVNTQRTSSSNSTSVTPQYNDDITDLFNVISFSTVKKYLTKTDYDMFIEVIETNSTTANMVDLINYIFNQVTGTEDYGEDLDFESVWKSSGFTTAGESSGTTLSGDTIQERIWIALKEEGYSDVAIAAVLGNIEKESGFQTGAINSSSGAYGLCQWMGSRKTNLEAFAKKKGVEPSDESLQIEYLIGELTQGGGADGFATYQFTGHESDKTTWETSSSIEDATNAYARGFERPGGTSFPERVTSAKNYYDKFHGASIGSNSGGGTIESSDTLGIKGYYTSTVSGRKFTLYSQNIQGSPWYWTEGCFVTSQATIASGFGSSLTPKDFSGFGGLGYVGDFQTKCGCQYSREYNIGADKMKQYLQDGKVIMIELKGVYLKTDNGSAYYSQHFVSVLDYKNENGVDKVYVHDPWEGSASYGWANLNDIVSVASCFDSVWK